MKELGPEGSQGRNGPGWPGRHGDLVRARQSQSGHRNGLAYVSQRGAGHRGLARRARPGIPHALLGLFVRVDLG